MTSRQSIDFWMCGFLGEGVKDSILPDISNTFATIRNQLLTGILPDFDSTRLTIQESKTCKLYTVHVCMLSGWSYLPLYLSFFSDILIMFISSPVTPALLEELSRLLSLLKLSNKKLLIPRSLEQNIQSSYDDLVYDAKYVQYQCLWC